MHVAYEGSKPSGNRGKPNHSGGAKKKDEPLKFHMEGVPRIAGPSCLSCSEPINTKLGSRARNGFVHGKCEDAVLRRPDEFFALAVQKGLVPLEALDA